MSLYRIMFDGQESFVEASRLARAEEAWLSAIRSEPYNSDFNREPDSIELLSIDPVIREETPPCPTPTGAQSADAAIGAKTATPDGLASSGEPHSTSAKACSAGPDTPSSYPSSHATTPPTTGDPEVITQARKVIATVSLWGWNISTDLLASVLAAYDAEVAHHARTTATLQAERAALTIERAKIARITALLIDPMLTDRQAVERALPVAKGQA